MRTMAFIPLLCLAACGSGETQKNATAPATASGIAAGQWELTTEVTAFRAADAGPPKINTPVGTRATESVCVDGDRPPAAFFVGGGYTCGADGTYYVRNGRLNVTSACSRDGFDGSVETMADGTFTADTAEFSREARTLLSGDGDVEVTTRVTGRRTGDCAPGGNGGDNSATAG